MGLVFLLPLVVKILAYIGILNIRTLKQGRKYAMVLLLLLAAIITPSGDPLTMLVVFAPLYILYEVSLIFVKLKSY
ncbi:MAG: twin-arginine translocase subunit TatC, partial [Porphyromonas sp.]|nr:twin-arginine translocase subunit TatC [Porphyromonas sp.]